MLKTLRQSRVAMRSRPPIKIVALCDGLIPSVELCIIKPLSYLCGLGSIEYEIFFENAFPPVEEIKNADVLFIMRSCTDETLSIAQKLKKGSKIIFMADDNIMAVLDDFNPENAIRRHYEHLNARKNFPALVGVSDIVIVFSKAMQEDLRAISKKVIVAPAISGIEMCDAEKIKFVQPTSASELRVGYAGSSTHKHDVAILGDALPRLLDEIPYLVIESIDQKFDSIAGHSRYRHLEGVKGLDSFFYLLLSRSWNIGLGPLSESRFNRSKTDNKYRSYAAVGIPGIYSDRPPFTGSVIHLKTGLLVDDRQENWHRVIHNLARDPGLRCRIARNAERDVRRRYGLPVVSLFYQKIFHSVLGK